MLESYIDGVGKANKSADLEETGMFAAEMEIEADGESADAALSWTFLGIWTELQPKNDLSKFRCCAVYIRDELLTLRGVSDRSLTEDCLAAIRDPNSSTVLLPIWKKLH